MRLNLVVASLLLHLYNGPVRGQTNVTAQMESAAALRKSFYESGTDVVGGTSTSAQQAANNGAKERSLEMGRQHTEKLMLFMNRRIYTEGALYGISEIPTDQCVNDIKCDDKAVFRTADGSCNNLGNPTWGRSFIPMRRFLASQYGDGVSLPRTKGVNGKRLPSPRKISTVLHTTDTTPSTESKRVSHMFMQFAQFLDHDITLTPTERGENMSAINCCVEDMTAEAISMGLNINARPECFPITVPPRDRRFKRICLNFVRSIQVDNSNCTTAPGEQLNELTAYVDGSQIYGSTQEEQDELRAFRGGQLKTSRIYPELLPENPVQDCITFTCPNFCFRAGDERVDEHMALTSLHTIWLREHNRIARTLFDLNPHWKDERLFQEARRIVGAMLQHITFTDFLPLVLSSGDIRRFNLQSNGRRSYYNSSLDASIRNSFATAAFRFGHSLIRGTFSQQDTYDRDVGSILLRKSFGNTSIILDSDGEAVNSITRGLVRDAARLVDRHTTRELTDFLFPDSSNNSLDLMALNIQRGRDHGLPGYNAWRNWCGLSTVTNLRGDEGGFVDHLPEVVTALRTLYNHPDDIDLWPAGVSERPMIGGLVGPTFSCILARQFQALKLGDRFFYETDDDTVKFTRQQLNELRRTSLARVICDNTNINTIQREVFKIKRRMVDCSKIRKVDLSKWREDVCWRQD